jgi:GNAT superfamily N-acetyltransferase
MNESRSHILELELANYQAILPIAQVTPGLEVIIRDDVVITSSETFPAPDTTHACLVRATPETVEGLITEVTGYFQAKGLPTTIYVSPACTPDDLSQHLLSRKFIKQEAKEAWLVLYDLLHSGLPVPMRGASVRPITKEEVSTFANTFMSAFEMPVDFAPYMAQLLQPCVGLPGVYHYLAIADGQPIGTCSLLCHNQFGILGSVGVLPEHRKRGAATNLAVQAAVQAREQGVDTLMLQTTAGTGLERLLRISGFKNVFVRTCYTLQ